MRDLATRLQGGEDGGPTVTYGEHRQTYHHASPHWPLGPARGALPRHFHQWEPGTKHEILCRFRDKKRNFVPGSRHKLHVPGFVTRVPSISNKRISINSQTGNVAAMLIAHLLSEFTHLLPLIITGLQGQDTPLSLFLCWIQGRGMQRGGAR